MSTTVTISDAAAAALAAEAARRATTPDAVADEIIVERLPTSTPKQGRRLSFTAIGESTSGKTAADAEDMLAEGFGR